MISEKSTPVATELAIRVGDALILPALLKTASCFSRAHWLSLSVFSDLGPYNYLNSIVICSQLYLGSCIHLLNLITDTFRPSHLRRNFIRGLRMSHSILLKAVYCFGNTKYHEYSGLKLHKYVIY